MVANDTAVDKTDVFQFMSVRSPRSVDSKRYSHFYIQNVYIGFSKEEGKLAHILREIFSINSESQIGKILYKAIFCSLDIAIEKIKDDEIKNKNDALIQTVLATLEPYGINCEEGVLDDRSLINDLEHYSYILSNGQYYLLPTKLENIISEFDIAKLIAAQKIIEKHLKFKRFDRTAILKELNTIFGTKVLAEIIYNVNGDHYEEKYQAIRNTLFDTLYILHILRRLTSINLEHIMTGLQTLHTLEYLAIDDFMAALAAGKLDKQEKFVKNISQLLPKLFEELQNFKLATPPRRPAFFISSTKELTSFFESTPIIHPLVARLFWYRKPFNEIKPIGIGDLKVVKQWLCGYKVGEISHIHNIMKSELKERTHRHLEKSEDILSFSSERSDNTQRESQTTDRFEMKREAENVIKSDLNISANTNFTYSNKIITASAGATFAYANSHQDTQRSAQNFAREVMDKATTQIQNKTSQNRSSTIIYETEETNKHTFTNTDPNSKHISGIYRWLDKKYKAQLYNYGKRLMFEFIIPEPAAFYVESKLRGFDFELDCPTKPEPPIYEPLNLGFNAQDIGMEPRHSIKYTELLIKYSGYDLSGLPVYPEQLRNAPFINLETNTSLFSKKEGELKNDEWVGTVYACKLSNASGYRIKKLILEGYFEFDDGVGDEGLGDRDKPGKNNILEIYINDLLVATDTKKIGGWHLREVDGSGVFNLGIIPLPLIENESVSLKINVQDGKFYSTSISAEFERDDDQLLKWQLKVYKAIYDIENAKLTKINEEKQIAYTAQLTQFRQRLSDLNATIINDIIQGKSEVFNRGIINTELKKHCLTLMTKEFDQDDSNDVFNNDSNDVFNNIDAIETKDLNLTNQRFKAEERLIKSDWHEGSFTLENGRVKLTRAGAGFKSKLEKPGYSIVVDLKEKGLQTYQISRVISVTELKLKASSIDDGQYSYRIDQETVLCGFEDDDPTTVKYPAINLEKAKKKAKYIQFLEQAFEWQQIAYIFYPYFWANEKNWIKLMNRLDYTDNNMTEFLKAGSVRVLVAVTPAYNEAVLHFLATREPWEGGPLPVIGDPLFIPIYEEIRKQQDDLKNAIPEGEPWEFEVPTSLIYLQDSSSPIPDDLKCHTT